MKLIGSSRALLLSAVAGAGIIGGGLFVGAGIVSAADPTPTPAPSQQPTAPGNQQQTPGTRPNGQQGTHDPANCPNMGNDSGTTPSSSSGSGPSGGGIGFRMQQRGPHA